MNTVELNIGDFLGDQALNELPYLWDDAKDPGEAYLIGDFVCLFAVQPRWMDHFLLDRALKKGEITKAEYDKEVQPFLSGKAVFTYPTC